MLRRRRTRPRRSGWRIARIARAGKQMRRLIENLLSYDRARRRPPVDRPRSPRHQEPSRGRPGDGPTSCRRPSARDVELSGRRRSRRPGHLRSASHRFGAVNWSMTRSSFTPATGRSQSFPPIHRRAMLFVVRTPAPGSRRGCHQVFERYGATARAVGEGAASGSTWPGGESEPRRSIWVDGEEGAGTTFSLALPLASRRRQREGYRPERARAGTRRLTPSDGLRWFPGGRCLAWRRGRSCRPKKKMAGARPRPDAVSLVSHRAGSPAHGIVMGAESAAPRWSDREGRGVEKGRGWNAFAAAPRRCGA